MEQKNSKKTMFFTRMDRMVLESYKTLCEGLANYLGDGYEIVLHSLENYDNSVIKIINGYYTGRKEGAPITDLALHMLMKTDDGANIGREENFADSPSQLVGDTIAETKRVVMADADIAVHDKNKEIIARLYSKGFFKLKNSVVECAEALGISKNTVYLHIRSCKNT